MKRKRIKRKLCSVLLAMILLVGSLGIGNITSVSASVWNNACSYYSTYGNQVVFCPISSTDGLIYYATKASKATTKTNFRTLGWKITVQNTSNTTLQTMYVKLGGSYMYHADTTVSGKYEYNLYSLSLYQVKSRMNAKASQALRTGKAIIKLDACMAVVKNGKVKGKMSDSGPTSGNVYTTYSGIAGAESWSREAKQSLYSYFNKYVEGLFIDVRVLPGEGIKSASGSGQYCYGTYTTVSAKADTGYEFVMWSGLLRSAYPEDGFYVNEPGMCIAEGTPKLLKVYYHRNMSENDRVVEYEMVRYRRDGVNLEYFGWKKDGKYSLGWAESASAQKPKYKLTARVSGKWIDQHVPEVHLYAVWDASEIDEDVVPDPTQPTPTPPIPPTPDPTLPTPVPDPPTPNPITPTQEDEGEGTAEDTKKPTTKKIIRCRFISSKYYEDEEGRLIPPEKGGLPSDSVWSTDLVKRQILRYALNKK